MLYVYNIGEAPQDPRALLVIGMDSKEEIAKKDSKEAQKDRR